MNRQQRAGRYGRPPAKLSRKQVRRILVDDAMHGIETPIQWAYNAYLYLGRGTGKGAEREFILVAQEVRSKGGVMPGAPGLPIPRTVP